jgi:uncharacterized membrane protein
MQKPLSRIIKEVSKIIATNRFNVVIRELILSVGYSLWVEERYREYSVIAGP